MKRQILIALAGLFALALVPMTVQAQIFYGESARRAWLGLSYETTFEGRGADRSQTIVITDIVASSPAQRAGLQAGDTLLRVNDIPATDQLLSSLGVSLKPGDEVEVSVRRDGREREFRVEAGTPPAGYTAIAPQRGIVTFDADSMRGRIRIMIDSARVHLDSLRIPNVYIERMPSGFRWGSDSLGFMRTFPFDSLSVNIDSLVTRYRLFADSVVRLDTLGASWYVRPGRVRSFNFNTDSAFEGAFAGGVFGFNRDSTGNLRRLDALPFAGISVWGARAIAGAELTELNPTLGEYFGTDNGVLVVRVPDGTPAATAGLRSGDVVVGADGRDITSIAELRNAMLHGEGTSVKLDILRKRERLQIDFRRD